MTNSVISIKQKRIKGAFKRTFDIVVILLISPIAILVTTLIFLMILIEQILTGDFGPVLIAEPRISRGRPFNLLKLNMFKEGPRQQYRKEDGYFEKYGSHSMLQKNSESLRFVGSFMKKFYMDELGQVINILRGEMSVVGPRPQPPIETSNDLPPRKFLKTGIFCFKANKWKNRGDTILQQESDMDYYESYASSSALGLMRLDILIVTDGIRAIIRGEGL